MNQNENNIPLVDLNLNEMDTSLPLIPNGIYDLVVAKSEVIDPTTADEVPSWKLELKTTQPTTSLPNSKGQIEQLPPGHPVYTQTQLEPTGKATLKMCAGNVAQIIQSMRPPVSVPPFSGGAKEFSAFVKSWHNMTMGHMVRCRVEAQPAGVSKKGKSYKAGNRVVEFARA